MQEPVPQPAGENLEAAPPATGTGSAPVVELHPDTDVSTDAREKASKWPERALTSTLAAAVLNKTLLELLDGPPIEHKYAKGVIEATHTIIRLEAGEPTSITRDEALAQVKALRDKAQERIAGRA